ncbi:MAG: Ig-like domain-containing protein [Gemmatimonadota bacterium]|nr:Ig-like domain-containing protein [Gemmatimonadota bacterium]
MFDCNPKPLAKEPLVAVALVIATLAACVDQPMAPDLDGARLHVPASSDRVFRGIDQAELDRLEREAQLGHPSSTGEQIPGTGPWPRDDEMDNPASGVADSTRPRELARSPARLDNGSDAASDFARSLDLDIPEVCHRDSPALDFERGWIFFDDDCDALLAAMDQLRGTVALNWDTATVMTEWDGVFLGTFGVERLYLHNRGLDGSLPPELGALDDIEVLSLGRNNLSGEIPPEMGSMTDLERLYLQDNQLTGEIPPEVGGMRSLERLYMWRNQLSGEIPPELGSIHWLERVNLGGNRLTGKIPPELGSLNNLVDLRLWGNELTGSIPMELGKLRYDLLYLSVSGNKLTGEIPPELADLRDIEALWLYDNQLTGPIPTPDSYGAWENLRVLWLHDNELSGLVPAELGNTALYNLAISSNAGLAGPLPLALQSLLFSGFYWGGTGLCSPPDPSFQAWLASIPSDEGDNYSGGPVCDSESGNRSPVRVGTPDDVTLKPGDRGTVDASDYFRDPDGDALTYSARSSNASVATVSVSGNTVTVMAVADGSATIRVTARDPGGLTAEQAFGVTVAGDTGGDYKTIGGLTITQSGALKWGNFTNSGCVGASRVTINGVDYEVHWTEWQRKDNAAGSAWAQVSGTRRNGQLCGYRLANAQAGVYRFAGEFTVGGVRGKYKSENEVTVGGDSGNQRPRTVGSISAKTLKPGDSTTVDASDYFRDPDGDALTYTASSSSASVATVSASGDIVTVKAVADGSATIRVTARDPGGLTAEQAFSVTVADDTGGDYKTLAGFRVRDDGGLTLRLGGLTNVVGKDGCIVASSFTLNGRKYGYHETWWERDTGSGWQELAGTKKTGRLCGYDLGSAPSGKYRAVGDMTIADVRDKYKSENEVTK